jgi:hypothetical protein
MGTCVFFTGYVGLFWQDHQIKSYSLRMIQPNFGSNWLSHFREEIQMLKVYRWMMDA